MKRLLYRALVALVVVMMSACSIDTVYHRYSHTSVSGWEKNDTLKFYVPRLRQGGNAVLTDTVNCTFSKPDGTRLTRGISYYQYSFPIAKPDLREGDSLVVSIYHDMKRDMLPGISDVGLYISRVSYLHNVLYK